METFSSIAEYRAWRNGAAGEVGYVASLGHLHDGHRSLLRRAREENANVVVTLFVNRIQFAEGEDFDKYPRDPDGDVLICAQEGADAVLLPSDEEMYPAGFSTRLTTSVSAGKFEAATRPDHFNGVATVVAKFLNIVRPHRTYFGLKDYQQFLVVRQLVRDLHLDVEVIAVPTARAADGLALSSRNTYLSPEERQNAPLLYRALREVQDCLDAGRLSAADALRRGREVIEGMSVPVTIDYFAVADANTLEPVEQLGDNVVALGAIRLPSARLIDNLVLTGVDRRSHDVGEA